MENYSNLVNEFKITGEGFDKIYSKIYNSLKYFIFGFVKDEDITNDILSVTMLAVHDNIEKYDSSLSEFNTWVFAIAKNNCLNQLKNSKRFVSIDASVGDPNDNNSQLKDLIESPPPTDVKGENNLQKLFAEVFKKIDEDSINGKILWYRHKENNSIQDIVSRLNEKTVGKYETLKKQCAENIDDSNKYHELSIERDLYYKKNIYSESFVKNSLRRSYEILRKHLKEDLIEQFLN
jgi:RNA polymerase sigma factor (sigma-70 family)